MCETLPEPSAAPRGSGGRGQLDRDGWRHCVGVGWGVLLLLLRGHVAHGLEKVVRAGGGVLLLLLLAVWQAVGQHRRACGCHRGATAIAVHRRR